MIDSVDDSLVNGDLGWNMKTVNYLGSPWLPSWETYPPAKNLDSPKAEKVPFHFRLSWVIKFIAPYGAFSARQSVRNKDDMVGLLCIMWLVHNLRKMSCFLGERFQINDLELLSSALSLSLVHSVCCIDSIGLCGVAMANPLAGSKDDPA